MKKIICLLFLLLSSSLLFAVPKGQGQIEFIPTAMDVNGYCNVLVGNKYRIGSKELGQFNNRIIVGTLGNYATLKEAVDWFNVSATTDTEILLDAGSHLVADTITVNNSSYVLQIRGGGINITSLEAATGLTNKPMFDIKSPCDIHRLHCHGNSLSNYGTLATENCIDLKTTNGIYCEFTDVTFQGFNTVINDVAGTSMFIYNYIIESPIANGILINTNNTGSNLDCEVGNMIYCPVGVNLLKGTNANFLVSNILFYNAVGNIAIKYSSATYTYDGLSNITNNTFNHVGTFLSGFDFTLAQNSNIEVFGNVGSEDVNPHAKINVVGSATQDSLTQNVWAKAGFLNTNAYTKKWTVSNNRLTFQSEHPKDVVMFCSGSAFTTNQSVTLNIAIVKNGDPNTLVYGRNSVTLDTNGRNFNFSLNAYLQDVTKDDYFEVWLMNSANSNDAGISNLNWFTMTL